MSLQDLRSRQLVIGFVGENEHTRILFGAGTIYGEYPHAAASLTVSAPGAAPYPAVVSRDGDYVVWNVVDSNLVHEGDGEIQLAFAENGVVVKTYIGRIRIMRSIVPTGEIPEALEDFLEQAGAALTAIPETIGEAFEAVTAEAETLAAGSAATAEFDGETKKLTIGVPAGEKGDPGDPGHTPVMAGSKTGKTNTITADGETIATILDGEDGDPGQPGVSPTVAIEDIEGGHRITITDAEGAHTADVMDGQQGEPGDPTELIDDTSTTDTDKVWSAKKSADTVSALNGAIDAKYTKPASGIPATDLESGVIPSVPVQDVQINGSSILSQGVANVQLASSSAFGVAKADGTNQGVGINNNGVLILETTTDNAHKIGTSNKRAVIIEKQHVATFYGLAKAAGDSTQASSSNSVGTYTETAQSKISDMLNAPVSVSGSTPSITAKAGIRYVCGEVATLSFTPSASGDCEVIFESGSTATVLTVPNTVKFPGWFDATSLEANKVYDIIITNGVYGVVTSWS